MQDWPVTPTPKRADNCSDHRSGNREEYATLAFDVFMRDDALGSGVSLWNRDCKDGPVQNHAYLLEWHADGR